MCGIVGYVGKDNAKNVVIDGLKRLEYRGYDSAGIALIVNGKLQVFKKSGKIRNLERELNKLNVFSNIGIGHTRWATHGDPTDINAHPHTDCTKTVAVVHNGIIENHSSLKERLIKEGHRFTSETDTEVIAHLIEEKLKKHDHFFEAFTQAVKELKGSYAIVAITEKEPDKLFVARKDSPLVLGIGDEETFVASDIPAFLSYTNKVVFLENGEVGVITPTYFKIFDLQGKERKKEITTINWSLAQAEKAGYKHFMLKEIYEQPRAVADTISGNLPWFRGEMPIKGLGNFKPERIQIVACGTSYYAGLVGKFYFENFARIPTEVDYASEYRYRNPVVNENTLIIAITQSGETADTLAAMRLAKERKAKVLTVCNVIGSSATRESDAVLYTYAGPEISVASTKAFTTQLTVLYLLSIHFAVRKNLISNPDIYLEKISEIPSLMEQFLEEEKKKQEVKNLADRFHKVSNALYLGRHVNYPIALEGALKLKEISYIHAEGYPAGEMKHGPIALIDENMPVVTIATKGRVYEKILSNLAEVKSRKGITITVTNESCKEVIENSDFSIIVPETDEFLSPLINVIPLQLLAYYIADFLGYDVDQPRNLAKSVTVE
ncbi:glucosamine--fructose-6-phosphate aminotransferase (isomerizing) [Desulfurobacterium pacificum]|uniref:Glutamine--fructose-6-phosphate aminotransferase [isomerizing] n=1 Tax=Desulfurobacterium pacificum TaxID=240166 RepID=A0ABY1N9R9_9BACT|nr:glutamine--fructose-6-phosphate transaminase (isomerizing) [Desulfurobacterium pacificum]SMP04297.1 glucosamine--fructose-6-phosphate aminotransferase (isomerizing) [Desulfurobacterium pacificum]